MPRVSVGMPVYNGEKFVADAIASILAQSFKDFELVISDNGSSDGTERICRGYAACDRRVRYYRSPVNRGAAWNYNRVFELSSAPYFKWAAHDDICAPEYLERCVDALDRNRAVVLVYPKNRIIDEEGRLVGEYTGRLRPPLAARLGPAVAVPGILGPDCNPVFGLMRGEALRKTRMVGNYIASDYIMLAQLALIGEFYELPQYLFFNRDHPYRSGRALRTMREHAAWYNPGQRGVPKRWWRLMIEYCRSIARAPLDARERMRCYWIWMKWARWHWASLAAELYAAPAKWAGSRQLLTFMRILLTGHTGYIGMVAAPMLAAAGHEVVGLDSGLFDGCDFGEPPAPIAGDAQGPAGPGGARPGGLRRGGAPGGALERPAGRPQPRADVGDQPPRVRFGWRRWPKRPACARFVFSSSCSTYGAAGDEFLDETAELNPVTAYGESKVRWSGMCRGWRTTASPRLPA